MSLINQMLKDLEQRNAPAEGMNPLSGEVRSVRSRSQSYAWVALVLLLALGAGIWWKLYAPAAAPVAPPVIAVVKAPVAPQPAPVEAVVPPPAPAAPAEPQTRVPGLDWELHTAPVAAAPNAPTPAPEKKEKAASESVPAAAMEPSKPAVEEKPREKRPPKVAAGGNSASVKSVSTQQKSENFYKQAVAMLQQGRVAEARSTLAQALDENPANHDARQLLVGLLVEGKRASEAVQLLQDGVKLAPDQSGFVMALARLQVESGNRQGSLQTLEQGLKYAASDAQYRGFYATLLQREGRHAEAVDHYLAALHDEPGNTSWLVGVGISLQAQDRFADAREAFERAKQVGQLSPELSDFVDQRLKQLKGK